jgi:hypothetical protein
MELVTTLAVMGILAGAIGLVPALLRWKSPGNPEVEAQHLARWLTDAMTISNLTGRPFRLFCPGNGFQPTVVAEWESPVERKAYTPLGDCRFQRWQDSTPRSSYAPQWGTFSPALSIEVANGAGDEHYVIVSGHGRVRTDRVPPPKGGE